MALFDAHMMRGAVENLFGYDITADGKRFLINTTGGSGVASTPMTVVANGNAGANK
jgi:hypothetical protein